MQAASFAMMGLGTGRGEGLSLSPFLSSQSLQEWAGRREQVAGFNSRCQPHPTAANRREGQQRCWWVLAGICDGRQAGTEFRGARGILPLT